MTKSLICCLLLSFLTNSLNAQYNYQFSKSWADYNALTDPIYTVPKDSVEFGRTVAFNFELEQMGLKTNLLSAGMGLIAFYFRDSPSYYVMLESGWYDQATPEYYVEDMTKKLQYFEYANGLKATVYEIANLAYVGFENEKINIQYWVFSNGKLQIRYGSNSLSLSHPLNNAKMYVSVSEHIGSQTIHTVLLSGDPENPILYDNFEEYVPLDRFPLENTVYTFYPASMSSIGEEGLSQKFKLNIAIENLEITPVADEEFSLSVMDISGKEVLSARKLKGKQQISVSHLESGVYLIKLRQGQHEKVDKIFIP